MSDWSLKDKKCIPSWDDDGIDWEMVNDYKSGYYESEDIDILRQKLIEDVRLMSGLSGCNPSVGERIVIHINKRFGVDE